MALQKIKKSLIWDKGIDTKTNEKLTDGFLKLENCQITNVKLQKTQGLEEIATIPPVFPNNAIPYTVNTFSTLNQLETAANNRVYEYDPLSSSVYDRGAFTYLDRNLALTTASTIIPYYYSEYGNFGVFIYQLANGKFCLKTQNLLDAIVINDFNATNGFLASTETPIGIVTTQIGYFLYTQTTGFVVNEYFYTYTTTAPSLSSATLFGPISRVVAGSNQYPDFKNITIEFDGSFIWLFYILSSGASEVTIRNLSGTTVTTLGNIVMGVPPITRNVPIYQNANLCSLFYNTHPVTISSTITTGAAVTLISVVFCLFGNTLCIFNPAGRQFLGKISLPTDANGSYGQSLGYLFSNSSIYVLEEDLIEYESTQGQPSRFFPTVIHTNLSTYTGTWDVANAAALQPMNYSRYYVSGTGAAEFGQGFVTGSLWATDNNMYFSIMSLAYPSLSNTTLSLVPPPANVHGNYYVNDINYNLVDFVIHYNGARNNFLGGVAGNISFTKSVPVTVLDTKPNRITGKIPYVFVKNTQVVIQASQVTFDQQTFVYDMGLPISTKLVNYDRGQTGYFGINNMYMATQSNVEYAQFLDYPVIFVSAPTAVNPTFIYTYAVTFEYINQNGELVRTAPSIFQSAKLTAAITSSTVSIYYTFPSALESKSPINIRVWRTTLNTQTFYKLRDFIFTPGIQIGFFVDPGTTDAALSAQELAYFNGGVLGEIPFDTFTTFTSHQNTIYAVALENQNIVEYSLPFQQTVAMATTFGFEFFVETSAGPIVELASLDEKLIIFTENYIYAVIGQPSDALGNNSTLTTPERITSPVGCSQKASVIRIPEIPQAQISGGILFKSTKGIYILERSLSLNYIGAPVEAFNNFTITSATLSQAENVVRFTTEEGTILSFDYFYNNWYTEIGINLVSTAIYRGNLVGVSAAKVISKSFDGYYKKKEPYIMTVSTPWIKMAGLQGFQRIYKALLLGDFVSTNVLSLGIMYDFVDEVVDWLYYRKFTGNSYGTPQWGQIQPIGSQNPKYGQSDPIVPQNPNAVFGYVEDSRYEIQFNMPRQKCQAIRFIITDGFDNLNTDTGNSFTITEFAIIAGIKSDSVKLPITKRV